MRLLLIAYEFPPSPSPQSLRWTYLTRELAALGHEVHVLAPDLGGDTPGLPSLPSEMKIHRTFPGPMRGTLAFLRNRRQRTGGRAETSIAAPAIHTALRPPRSWKQRVSERIQVLAERAIYPDIRGEWRPWAIPRLRRLLAEIRPDLVISSHEPATTLELGLLSKAAGYCWVADLGDPVLAGYTAARWRQRAEQLEKRVCETADLVTVTNAGTAELLRRRHGRSAGLGIVTQGYDDRLVSPTAEVENAFDPERLELLYTGSFYSFRRADALLQALDVHPSIRLSIAAVTVPEPILDAARAAPERIRLLGFQPHAAVVVMQRQADVLINIANDDMTQIPGKFYEYLGSGRPILHLSNASEPVAEAIVRLRRGWVCANTHEAIRGQLAALVRAKAEHALDVVASAHDDEVATYGWRRIAARLDALLEDTLAAHRAGCGHSIPARAAAGIVNADRR